MLLDPPPSPSALWMSQLAPLQPGMWYTVGGEYTFDGEKPLVSAVARVKALNDDPVWRPAPPPDTSWVSQQVALTSTLMVPPALGWAGQPPRAKLVDAYWPDPK